MCRAHTLRHACADHFVLTLAICALPLPVCCHAGSYRAPHRAEARSQRPKRTAVQAVLNAGRATYLPKRTSTPQRLSLRFKGVSGLDCAQLYELLQRPSGAFG